MMGRDNLTNQQTGVIAQHLKYCYGYSEMIEQSLSSKYFCISTGLQLQKYWPHLLYFVCSLWGTSNLSLIKVLYSVASPTFLSDI